MGKIEQLSLLTAIFVWQLILSENNLEHVF